MTDMTKAEAIELSGGLMKRLCLIVGKKPPAVSMWPEVLNNDQKLMVIGGLVINNIEVPSKYLKNNG